jgi:acetylornithine/N-succinyldiaminopimelate aminotransferase
MDKKMLEKADEILINVYSFWPVMFEKGDGCYLFDTDGRKYLDFGAAIAVNQLGYNHPVWTKALQEQIETLHLGLCYVVDPQRLGAAEELLASANGDFDQVFFCSTGAEAVEGALKTARKWSKETKSDDCTEVIYARNSFHGRTMGALSVNGQECYRKGFYPMLPGMHEAVFNDLASFEKHVSDKTSAIIIEPVQGEGGIVPGTDEFIRGLRQLCDKHDIALIFDEVQCGMGRTDKLHAYQNYGVVPDLICLAKGLGAGFPVGAYMGKRKYTSHITHGSHGSTYGGNPLACRAVRVVLNELGKPGFLQNVNETGQYLQGRLREVAAETGAFENIRGKGLMIAADYTKGKAKELVMKLLDAGLVALPCGNNALRFVPPLIIGRKEVDEAIEILGRTVA